MTLFFPMIKFRLTYGFANKGALAQIDKRVRSWVRKALHLPKYTDINAFYVGRRNGGLGVPCLVEEVPVAQQRLAFRMSNSGSSLTRILAQTRGIRHVEPVASLEPPFIEGQSERERAPADRLAQFLLKSQGSGWSTFKQAPRLFLDNPRSRNWSERDAIDSIKMRSNVLMCRELAARTAARNQGISRSCRSCHAPSESQAHILSKCPSTQQDRIARHDCVVRYLGARLAATRSATFDTLESQVHLEYRVVIEPGEVEGFTGRRTLRPDIAVINNDCITLIEVSVVYENELLADRSTLRHIYREKLRKYSVLRSVFANRSEGRRCVVRPFIVGCRGGWLRSNDRVFNGLGVPFTEHDRNCCVERAVRGSLIAYRRFLARTNAPLLQHLGTRSETS